MTAEHETGSVLLTSDPEQLRGPDDALRDLLNETGIPPLYPWAAIFTRDPVTDRDDRAQFWLAGHYQAREPNGRLVHVEPMVPIAVPIIELGEDWRGYHLVLFGLLRHVAMPDLPPFARPATTPGCPPAIFLECVGLELWRARAYRSLIDPLIAEQHWWPGQKGAVAFSRETIAPGARIASTALTAARDGRKLLHRLPLRLNKGGSPKGWRKGRVWTRREILEWYSEAGSTFASDRTPTLSELGADMGVSAGTAGSRVRGAELHWPPTSEELDELEGDE